MISRALKLTTPRLVVEQIATAAVVFLLFLLWLRIPDSSWLYVLVTVFVSLLLAAAFGVGETRLLCRLTPTVPTRKTFLRGTLILLAAILLWFAWSTWLDYLSVRDSLYAGYLNSRFPHGLRHLFTYEHLITWFDWFWSLLTWIGAGILAVIAFHLITSARPGAAIRRNLRSVRWWLTFLIGTQCLFWLTGKLTGWTPGHGLRVETLSLILRLIAVTFIDAALLVFLVATCAAFSTAPEPVHD